LESALFISPLEITLVYFFPTIKQTRNFGEDPNFAFFCTSQKATSFNPIAIHIPAQIPSGGTAKVGPLANQAATTPAKHKIVPLTIKVPIELYAP
jgi:hypothetical protein